ncbi:MAG: hypothetical protein ABIH23_10695 [bacterium]
MTEETFQGWRTGKKMQHIMPGLFRQSVFGVDWRAMKIRTILTDCVWVQPYVTLWEAEPEVAHDLTFGFRWWINRWE